jgi:hypothetical protein
MLRLATRFFAGVGLLALAFGGAAQSARADFVIEVSTNGGYFQTIDDNGIFDSNPDLGAITVDVTQFNQDLAVNNTGFKLTQGLGASTNALDGSGSLATLSINGEIQRTNAALGGSTITFVTRSSANPPPDYSYPFPGGALALNSSTGGTFLTSSAGDGTTFQSTFTDAASNSTSSTNLALGAAPSYSADSPEVALGTRPVPFDPTSTLTVTLNGTLDKAQFSGTTTVRAIPEPGSIALMMLGGAGLVAVNRRRRRATA